MATLQATNNTTMIKIRKFLGLNENADGDSQIKTGELSVCNNFRITKDGHLQIRPGTYANRYFPPKQDGTFDTIYGAWFGTVHGADYLLVNYGGKLYKANIGDGNHAIGNSDAIGTLNRRETCFIPFGGNVYIIDGNGYYYWTGTGNIQAVTPYVPVVQTATTPQGEGSLLENVNRLSRQRRVQFSPDGTSTQFVIPNQNIASFDKITINGTVVSASSVDLVNGKFTLASAPEAGINTMECTYSMSGDASSEVYGMKFHELYNGTTDSRIFLYGDGSNKTIYSGLDENGVARADYFPDLYEIAVGELNTPITSLVRHHSRLMAFKQDSAWTIYRSTVTTETDDTIPAFYCSPVNRQFGNEAPGQVILLENNPITFDSKGLYEWKKSSYYSSYISDTENNTNKISDRINDTVSTWDMSKVRAFNIKCEREFWIIHNHVAVVLNYATNSWYVYKDVPFEYMFEDNDAVRNVFGVGGGNVYWMSREWRGDHLYDGSGTLVDAPIDALAETGSMSFDAEWLMKYSPMLFVAMKPESNARVQVTVHSNRKSDYPVKTVAYGLSCFDHLDFNHFSFSTNYAPQTKRVKIKVKKAAYYKLAFESSSVSATATILSTDIQVRTGGKVK